MMDQHVIESPVSFLESRLRAGDSPGAQYRFFSHDSVLVRYDGGLADVASRTPVSHETTFNGFSVTKTFTALAVLQLAEEGKVVLDKPAAEYIPNFPYPREISVRQLLSHSAGIPNPIPLNWIHPPDEHATFDRDAFFDEQFAAHSKVKALPNARYAYSNLGYVLLGQLIEQVTGMSYEKYVTDRIVKPLRIEEGALGFETDRRMQATGYHPRLSASYLILGFLLDKSKYIHREEDGWMAFRPYFINGTPYGGIVGTADGYSRYVQALLSSPSPLLSEDSKRLLFTENILNDGRPSRMTLSWFHGKLDEHTYYAHAGGGGGYYAEIRIYPDLGRGSVILLNRSGMSDKRYLDNVDRIALRMQN